MAIRIVLAGGGSGGHLFPLVTVAKHIKENHSAEQVEFLFMGPKTKLEQEIMKANNIPHKGVLCGKLHRYMTARYFLDVIKMPLGVVQALWRLLFFMPDVVFSKGGFASVPIVIAARIYGIPVLIHESDSIPGMANKFLGSIASKIALTFERAKVYFPVHKIVTTGVPVRSEAINGDPQTAREILNIHKEVRPTILILGGSQGAQLINEKVLLNLKDLLRTYQIIHQTGEAHFDAVKHEAERQGYKIGHSDYYPIPFIKEDLKHFFALADVVVSRAGSTTISEIAANKKASILVPIQKSANNHQRINAYEVSKAGGAIVLEESNFRKSMLLHNIQKVLDNQEFRQGLSEGVATFYHPDATEKIAQELFALIKK